METTKSWKKGNWKTLETERKSLCWSHGKRKCLAGEMTRMATRTTTEPQSMQRFAKAKFRPTKPYLSHVTVTLHLFLSLPITLSLSLVLTCTHAKFWTHFGFWNRIRMLVNWIWLACVQSSTWLLPQVPIDTVWFLVAAPLATAFHAFWNARQDMSLPWKLANTFSNIRNFPLNNFRWISNQISFLNTIRFGAFFHFWKRKWKAMIPFYGR